MPGHKSTEEEVRVRSHNNIMFVSLGQSNLPLSKKFQKMGLSIRTMKREGMWAKLVRSLPIGSTVIGTIADGQYDTLRVTIGRINKRQDKLTYSLTTKDVFLKGKGEATITVSRRE